MNLLCSGSSSCRAIVDTIDRRNLEGTEEKFEKVLLTEMLHVAPKVGRVPYHCNKF